MVFLSVSGQLAEWHWPMTPTSLQCHILQAVKSMSETRRWGQRGSEKEERTRRRRGVMLGIHEGKTKVGWGIPVLDTFIMTEAKIVKSPAFYLFIFCLPYCFFNFNVLVHRQGCSSSSLSLSQSWSDHTPHVSQGYQTGETSSDLANKRSINGAVERVTHASQNLLRSNSPLQLPLHWSDPWVASQRDWPEDSHRVVKSHTYKKKLLLVCQSVSFW